MDNASLNYNKSEVSSCHHTILHTRLPPIPYAVQILPTQSNHFQSGVDMNPPENVPHLPSFVHSRLPKVLSHM